MSDQEHTMPRAKGGKFMPRQCPDPNCDGVLVWSKGSTFSPPHWHCNGLTHDERDGDLVACNYVVTP